MRQRSWVFSLPAEPMTVWDLLVRYENDIALSSPGSFAFLEHGDPGVPGAVYSVRVGWEGLQSSFRVRLAAADPGVSMRWYSKTGPSSGQALYELSADEYGGTHMELHLSLALAGAFGALEPFGWALLTKAADSFVANLQKHTFDEQDAADAAPGGAAG